MAAPASHAGPEHARWRAFAGLATAAAALTLAVSLALPTVTFRKVGSAVETYSIYGGIEVLWEDGNWILATIVFFFSIVFPTAKLAVLALLWWRGLEPQHGPAIRVLRLLGKWSLLDVFIVGLFVGAIRIGIATASSRPGIHLFALAILLSMFAAEIAARATRTGHRTSAAGSARLGRPLSALVALAAAGAVAVLFASTVFFVRKALLFGNEVQLWSMARALAKGGEPLLAAGIALFLFAIPTVRALLGLRLRLLPVRGARSLRVALALDEWAMVPVFGLALTIVRVKLDELATVELQVGFWAAVAAAVLTELDAWLLRRDAR